MKLTNRQEKDIETAKYFIPSSLRSVDITHEHIREYLDVSERGTKNDGKFDRNPLIQGKRWREWHMRSWEETVLEGTTPYIDLVEGLPRPVVEYMKKSMFGGSDSNAIEKCYQESVDNS